MRALLLVGVLSMACTRLNPSFENGAGSSEGEDDGRPSTGDTAVPPVSSTSEPPATSGADSVVVDSGTTSLEPETTSTLDGPRPDLGGEPTCELQPSLGASIQLGDPKAFGGLCPNGMDIWTQVVSNEGAEVVLETCNEACIQCLEPLHPLSVSPLVVGDVLPGTCMLLQARTLLEEADSRCHWGALTIHDPLLMSPYLIVTARSSDPTPAAMAMLGEAVPDPTHAFDCECSSLRAVSDCCEDAGTPSFWGYVIGGTEVNPGEQAPIDLPVLGPEHTFQVFQAQQVPGCGEDVLMTSWAVVAP